MDSYWIVDSQSGEKLEKVIPSAGSARTVLNGVGYGRHTFQTRDSQFDGIDSISDLFRGQARALVYCWNDVPQYAGVILRDDYRAATGEVVVDHEELEWFGKHRHPFVMNEFDPAANFAPVGKSWRGVLRAIYDIGFRRVPGDAWHFPVVLEADEAGTASPIWPHWRRPKIEDMKQYVQSLPNGPDSWLQPRWSSDGTLEWAERTGSPRLTGGFAEFVVTAKEAAALGAGWVRDSKAQRTGMYAPGDGHEVAMPVGQSPFGGIPGSRVPNTDGSIAFKTVQDKAELDALALANLQTVREPTTQFPIEALKSDVLPGLTLGGTALLKFDRERYMGTFTRDAYVIGMEFKVGSERVGLEAQ